MKITRSRYKYMKNQKQKEEKIKENLKHSIEDILETFENYLDLRIKEAAEP